MFRKMAVPLKRNAVPSSADSCPIHDAECSFLVLSDEAEFCYKCDDFYHANDEGGLAWNDPEIGIKWPEVIGTYNVSADASGYTLSDGSPLILSEKDQKWLGIKDTFKF